MFKLDSGPGKWFEQQSTQSPCPLHIFWVLMCFHLFGFWLVCLGAFGGCSGVVGFFGLLVMLELFSGLGFSAGGVFFVWFALCGLLPPGVWPLDMPLCLVFPLSLQGVLVDLE